MRIRMYIPHLFEWLTALRFGARLSGSTGGCLNALLASSKWGWTLTLGQVQELEGRESNDVDHAENKLYPLLWPSKQLHDGI
jgi:hypothetical protein